jgi:hypothetical protein
MFVVLRITGMYDLPLGIFLDVALIIGVLGVLWRKPKINPVVYNAVTIVYCVSILYTILQVANPAQKGLMGWLVIGMRSVVFDLSILAVCFYAIRTANDIKFYIKFFLAIAFLAGLYGLYQEHVGFPGFDETWVRADDDRFKLIYISGKLRVWSFLMGVSAYGVVMAYFSLMAIVLSLAKMSLWKRLLLLFAAGVMLVGMGYSGTRTAYVMFPIGFAFYALLTINKRSTIIASVIGLFGLLVILYGPIYGGTLSRIRTSVNFDEDPSYMVREVKMARLRPYMYSHPLGGGIASTLQGRQYHPGHELAGTPPDSGYLQTALEKGWIGLIIACLFNFTVINYGARSYFRMNNPELKNYLAAMLTAYFGVSIAHISQNAVGYPPLNVFNIIVYISVFALPYFDKHEKLHEFSENETANS